jgi:hypothetical protein
LTVRHCVEVDGVDHPDHANLIRRDSRWRDAHTDDPVVRHVVGGANTVAVA